MRVELTQTRHRGRRGTLEHTSGEFHRVRLDPLAETDTDWCVLLCETDYRPLTDGELHRERSEHYWQLDRAQDLIASAAQQVRFAKHRVKKAQEELAEAEKALQETKEAKDALRQRLF